MVGRGDILHSDRRLVELLQVIHTISGLTGVGSQAFRQSERSFANASDCRIRDVPVLSHRNHLSGNIVPNQAPGEA